jgi:hypothetical protein
MIEATFYNNGFVIEGHAESSICSELSMHTFTYTMIMLNLDKDGEYKAEDNAGYGHFIFNHENPTLIHIFSVCKAVLKSWVDKWEWKEHLAITEKDELLRVERITLA